MKKRDKFISYFFSIVGAVFLLGTIGALELNSITVEEAIIRAFFSFAMIILAYVYARVS